MKRAFLWAVPAALLTALLCLAIYYYTPVSKTEHGNLTVWYAETDCPRPVMDALMEDYRSETRCLVTAVVFPDEAALADAFENGKPDLLLCSHVRAWDMNGRAGLSLLDGLPPLPEAVWESVDGINGGFFPFGGRLPLLLMDGKRVSELPGSLETLLEWAAKEKKPVLAADSWADLLYQEMFSQGRKLRGVLKADLRDEDYVKLYNALASCAYEGGIAGVGGGAEYVRQGLLACAAVPSSALSGLRDEEGLIVSALPLPEGGQKVYSAELMGFAFLGEKKIAGEAKDFLTWLGTGDHSSALALKAGLVPLTAVPEEETEKKPETEPEQKPVRTAFEGLLCSLAEEGSLRYIDPASDYCKNRDALERRLRQSLDLLT